MMKLRLLILPCLAVFHTPDGREIKIDTNVTAVRPVEHLHGHLAKGTGSVIYIGGEQFGVTETLEEVASILKNCQ